MKARKTSFKSIMRISCCWLFVAGLICAASAQTPVVILHTNDIHSQVEPLSSDDARYPNLGGMLRWEALCRQVRDKEPHVLVFESGDFVQGTPYFNFFKGNVEVELLNAIKPTAITLGNHEFDNGVEALALLLKKARFPVVCTNYEVKNTPLEKLIKPWLIVACGNVKVGVVSANIQPNGLIDKKNCVGITWQNPIPVVEETAAWLKQVKKCDVVICLSHLGYKRSDGSADDLKLAAQSKSIDVILGGHSHTYMRRPELVPNLDGNSVIINQVGKSGVYVGRLDLLVE